MNPEPTQLTLPDLFDNIGIWWAIRLTDPDLTLAKTFLCLSVYEKFIVAEEGDGFDTQLHHHILLVTDDSGDNIKTRIREIYPNIKGNKSIYCRPARDKNQLLKYTVKEDKFQYRGFNPDHIERALLTSRPKTDLKSSIIRLEDRYVLHQIDTAQFLEQYLLLKVKHGQKLYTSHLTAYVRSLMIRAGHLNSRDYAESIIYNITNN